MRRRSMWCPWRLTKASAKTSETSVHAGLAHGLSGGALLASYSRGAKAGSEWLLLPTIKVFVFKRTYLARSVREAEGHLHI